MKSILYFAAFSILAATFIFQPYQTHQAHHNSEVIATEDITKKAVEAELLHIEFEDQIIDADLIAKVKIGKLLDEFDEPSPKTLLEASILNVIKGNDQLTSIQVLQKGNSKWIFENNDILQEGSEHILFLKHTDTVEQPHTFWIYGEETGMYADLGNGLLEKAAYPAPQLRSIETVSLSQSLSSQSETGRIIQIVYEDLFIDLIETYLDNE